MKAKKFPARLRERRKTWIRAKQGIPELSCVGEKDTDVGRGPTRRGGAFAPYKRFAAGETLAGAEFTSAEHFKFPRFP